jgi:hypothetical protein
MPPSIRLATLRDLPAIVALLLLDAEARRALDPMLWRIATDASTRIEKAVGAALTGSQTSAGELWFVAEQAAQIVGVTHAVLVPVPPIYDGSAGRPGLLLDDCFISADAPSGTAEALLTATEAGLVSAGAPRLIASCPVAGPLRPLYEHHGYEPVTLYMAKHRFSSDGLPPEVRPASAEDVAGIVKRSVEHRRTLARIDSRFWHIHPEADSRFEAWMRRSLTFKDRDMLDDFYDEDFADISAMSTNASSGVNLLAAAEGAFTRRAIDSAVVVCPAGWPSKIALLHQRGYRTGKLWMLRR